MLPRNESSTGANVPWNESSTGAKVLYGLFAPGNESAEGRKGLESGSKIFNDTKRRATAEFLVSGEV